MFQRATSDQIARARKLRREMTIPERRLWAKLKILNAQGYHFRRQVPFGAYTLDFAEHNARLAIELDGEQHGLIEHRVRDVVRDRFLAGHGYVTLRYWNGEVHENLDGVAEAILRRAAERIERPPP